MYFYKHTFIQNVTKFNFFLHKNQFLLSYNFEIRNRKYNYLQRIESEKGNFAI